MQGYVKPTVSVVRYQTDDVIRTSSDVVLSESVDWTGHLDNFEGGELE